MKRFRVIMETAAARAVEITIASDDGDDLSSLLAGFITGAIKREWPTWQTIREEDIG